MPGANEMQTVSAHVDQPSRWLTLHPATVSKQAVRRAGLLAPPIRGFRPAYQTAAARAPEATSNRSRFITLVHAPAKSRTNFSFESLHA